MRTYDWLRKPRSEATKAKISAALRARHSSPGTEFPKGSVPWNAGKRTYIDRICDHCQRPYRRPKGSNSGKRYCSWACKREHAVGANHHNWRGGRFKVTSSGYMRVTLGGRSQYEHIVVAEKALGRKMHKGECVHHLNGVKSDNRPQNLLICTDSYHHALNARMALLYQKAHFPPPPA